MEQTNKMSKKKVVLLIIVVTVLALSLSFVGHSYATKTFMFAQEQRDGKSNFTYALDEMVLNLNSPGNYLKTEIALGYSLEKDLDLLLKYEVQIRDSIIGILRSKSIEEIMPVENTGPLKGEILTEVNKCLGEQVVTDVYIIDFMVQ